MTDNPCNCSTCKNKRCVPNEIVDYKNYRNDMSYIRCLIDDKILSADEFCKICHVGCLSHQNARKYFIKDVVVAFNGKKYPFWSQFVKRKEEFIGGILQDFDDNNTTITKITDVCLTPNGNNSAFFSVEGENFSCGFDCHYGGVVAGEREWITFEGYAGHTWRIKKHD